MRARNPYITYGNSQEEADALLAAHQHNRRVIARLLRERIAFLEGQPRPFASIEYQGLYALHARLAKLEGRR
jgi:hypothetical protein